MKQQKIYAYKKIFEKIASAKNIALISHINPDIDTLWSSTAFFQVIAENYPHICTDLICASPIPEKYLFLAHTQRFKKDFFPDDYDLIIFFDSGSKNQTWFDAMYPKLYDKNSYNTISIDHHITNEIYARQNILNVWYAATTMIITEIFHCNNIFISPTTATALLCWIYTDTWWLKHSNTSSLTYKIVWYLIALWAQIDTIVENFFMNNSLSQIKLWGRIMKESFIDSDQVLHAYVHQSLLDSFWCSYDDIGGVIDILNTVEWIKYSTLLTQKWQYVKCSLRTLRDDIDLSAIAKKFSWWWHKKASGFTTFWTIEAFQTLQLKPN